MKKIIFYLAIILFCSCEEKPKPPPRDVSKDIQNAGRVYRAIKDDFKKGYNDTLRKDTIKIKI